METITPNYKGFKVVKASSVVYRNTISKKPSWPKGFEWACVDDLFPIEKTTTDPMNWGIQVEFRVQKKNYESIPNGEEHFDFVRVEFYSCPDGRRLFDNKTPKTIAQAYTEEALKILRDKMVGTNEIRLNNGRTL